MSVVRASLFALALAGCFDGGQLPCAEDWERQGNECVGGNFGTVNVTGDTATTLITPTAQTGVTGVTGDTGVLATGDTGLISTGGTAADTGP